MNNSIPSESLKGVFGDIFLIFYDFSFGVYKTLLILFSHNTNQKNLQKLKNRQKNFTAKTTYKFARSVQSLISFLYPVENNQYHN